MSHGAGHMGQGKNSRAETKQKREKIKSRNRSQPRDDMGRFKLIPHTPREASSESHTQAFVPCAVPLPPYCSIPHRGAQSLDGAAAPIARISRTEHASSQLAKPGKAK